MKNCASTGGLLQKFYIFTRLFPHIRFNRHIIIIRARNHGHKNSNEKCKIAFLATKWQGRPGGRKERRCTTLRRRNEYWSSPPGQDASTTLDRRRIGARLFDYGGTTEELFRLTFLSDVAGISREMEKGGGMGVTTKCNRSEREIRFCLRNATWLPAKPHCFGAFYLD